MKADLLVLTKCVLIISFQPKLRNCSRTQCLMFLVHAVLMLTVNIYTHTHRLVRCACSVVAQKSISKRVLCD